MALGSRLRALYRAALGAYREFRQDGGSMLSAALAYHVLFAMAPALVLLAVIAVRFVGSATPDGPMVQALNELLGAELAEALTTVAGGAAQARADVAAGIVGLALLVWAVVLLYMHLQDVFNRMWRVYVRPGAEAHLLLWARVRRFSVMLVPFAVLAALALANALASTLGSYLPLGGFDIALSLLSSPMTVALAAWVSFLVLLKFLPDAHVPWRPAVIAAAVAALGWTLGTYLYGLYLSTAGTIPGYGPAGAVFVLLLWLNYSTRLVLVCCKMTKLWVEFRGGGVQPLPHATLLHLELVED